MQTGANGRELRSSRFRSSQVMEWKMTQRVFLSDNSGGHWWSHPKLSYTMVLVVPFTHKKFTWKLKHALERERKKMYTPTTKSWISTVSSSPFGFHFGALAPLTSLTIDGTLHVTKNRRASATQTKQTSLSRAGSEPLLWTFAFDMCFVVVFFETFWCYACCWKLKEWFQFIAKESKDIGLFWLYILEGLEQMLLKVLSIWWHLGTNVFDSEPYLFRYHFSDAIFQIWTWS